MGRLRGLKKNTVLYLIGCLWGAFSYAKTPEFTWENVLNVLNEPTKEDAPSLPFTHALEDDLLKLNEEELKKINQKWLEKNTQGTKDSIRQEKNTYFHKEVTRLNEQFFKSLEAFQSSSPKGKDHREAAKKAMAKISSNAVTDPRNVYQFKDGGQIGFCFSRAMLIHYWLLKEGVPANEIAKVFVIGELMVKKLLWRFHVAVWVKDPIAGFIVVDPLQTEVLPYKEWLKLNTAIDIKAPLSRARFYMTSPRKFLPGFGGYEMKLIKEPHFKEYFDQVLPIIAKENKISTKK